MNLLEQVREQCAAICDSYNKMMEKTGGNDSSVAKIIGHAIRAMPLPEVKRINPEVQGMADCMDMVRNDLVEMGVIEKSVPPMMIPEGVAAYLQGKTEALQQENHQLRELLCFRSTHIPYVDDGELQDNSKIPFIDYKRDSIDTIKAKLTDRTFRELKGGGA